MMHSFKVEFECKEYPVEHSIEATHDTGRVIKVYVDQFGLGLGPIPTHISSGDGKFEAGTLVLELKAAKAKGELR